MTVMQETLTEALPFGVTRALPVAPAPARSWPGRLSYCPTQQVTVTADGVPFVDAPSMGSSVQTVTQTREDSQIFDDNGGTDTD